MHTRPRLLFLPSLLTILGVTLLPCPAGAQQAAPQATPAAQAPADSPLPAVKNFTRVDATLACGGALSGDAIASIKQAGFKSIVNLRAATEEGANVEAHKRAAEQAGLTYIWLPFVVASPDPAKVDAFLAAAVDPANQPMLLHCARGVRASMFWAIKRVMVDGWPVDKAMDELPALSRNVPAPLKNFALDYLRQHGK